MTVIFHLAQAEAWNRLAATGRYRPEAVNPAESFLHFSTAEQVEESCRRHKAGEPDLVLVAADSEALGDALVWETSRGGALFPHLYGELPQTAVLWTQSLALDANGAHVFPPLGDIAKGAP